MYAALHCTVRLDRELKIEKIIKIKILFETVTLTTGPYNVTLCLLSVATYYIAISKLLVEMIELSLSEQSETITSKLSLKHCHKVLMSFPKSFR